MANHQKQWVLTASTVHWTSFNRPKSHFPPQCKMSLRVCLTPVSDHRHSLSCPSPFMLRATQVDLSLLVCAVEDSWTSSFLYKSPSEPDSGDSDLITAGNKRYQHHLGGGFIFSFPHYSLLLSPQSRTEEAHAALKLVAWGACAFTVEFRLG